MANAHQVFETLCCSSSLSESKRELYLNVAWGLWKVQCDFMFQQCKEQGSAIALRASSTLLSCAYNATLNNAIHHKLHRPTSLELLFTFNVDVVVRPNSASWGGIGRDKGVTHCITTSFITSFDLQLVESLGILNTVKCCNQFRILLSFLLSGKLIPFVILFLFSSLANSLALFCTRLELLSSDISGMSDLMACSVSHFGTGYRLYACVYVSIDKLAHLLGCIRYIQLEVL